MLCFHHLSSFTCTLLSLGDVELGHFLLLAGHLCRKMPCSFLSNPRTIYGGAEVVKDKNILYIHIATRTISLVLACVALSSRVVCGGSPLSYQFRVFMRTYGYACFFSWNFFVLVAM